MGKLVPFFLKSNVEVVIKMLTAPNRPVNILNAVISSARSRRRCKEGAATAASRGRGGDEYQL